MSEWCANCHTGMLQGSYTSGMAGLRHPAGNGAKLTADIVANYNAYVRSGVMTNVTAAAAFSTLAPFEIGTTDYTVLKAAAVTGDRPRQPEHAGRHRPRTTWPASPATAPTPRASRASLRFFYLNEFMTVADTANAAIYDSSHDGEQDQLRLQRGPAAERVLRPPGHRVRPVRPQLLQQVPREGLVVAARLS